ncbi:RsmE family RNA methyltransferase [Telmatobacter bradus]|uniref:RsmE family RNA methyltransferase n=1 Tax=Telmatobacter bradus TaxID=474953 RepID=UPI003B434C8C
MTRRRWIADKWDEQSAMLVGAQAAHMARVLRAQAGMEADVVAGGRVFHAVVQSATPEEVVFRLGPELDAEPALPVTLVVSIYKFDRMEWAIEKATELGVAAILPAVAQRTEKHLAQSAIKRVERWRRIAHEAAQQSRRADVPQILDPVSLTAHIKSAPAAGVQRIVLAEQERTNNLRSAVEAAVNDAGNERPQLEIAIGPEGGWSPQEEALFAASDWKAVTLGPRILRAETAALTALSVVAAWMD